MGSRDKFVELAEKRVTKALKDIHLIGNLSNKNNYEYTEVDYKKIINALDNAVKNVKKRFEENSKEEHTEFKL
ncbi:hypothetical protein [Sulfurovum sp. AR]|uniref:hypothetical protein n=1 Tax=Sulfurovum sp. AR TaxID=1165841 RepID=UPI00025C4CC7|nr:hypothetical protein [Sulfurovum sp. AR]EIF51375.1 hypothetical protein SULAR_03987 [Sulfurovum sp. AR]